MVHNSPDGNTRMTEICENLEKQTHFSHSLIHNLSKCSFWSCSGINLLTKFRHLTGLEVLMLIRKVFMSIHLEARLNESAGLKLKAAALTKQ